MPVYCPAGHGEFRDEITVCPECGEALVREVEGEEAPLAAELVPVLDTEHPALLERLVDNCEAEGIPYVVQAGTALALLRGPQEGFEAEPWMGRVLVTQERAAEAVAILEDFRRGVLREPERPPRELEEEADDPVEPR